MSRLALFVGVLGALLAAAAVATWRADPFSEFYDPGVLTAALANRPACLISNGVVGPNGWLPFKLDVFRRRAAHTVVLGSSRALKIRAHPGEADFTNLGIPGTGTDTLEPIFRILRAEGHRPLTVYLGVELFWFNHTYSSTVHVHVGLLAKLRYLLDRQNVQESLRLIRAEPQLLLHRRHIARVGSRCVVDLLNSPVEAGTVDAWESDGSFEYRFELVPSVGRPAGDYKSDFNVYYRDWNRVDPARLDQLDKALAFAHAAGWRVVGFAPPYSRAYRLRLSTDPRTAREWRAFSAAVAPLFARYHFPFLDLRDVARIPCADDVFIDNGVHVDATCADRIRNRLDAAAATRQVAPKRRRS
jgi:hypothetical protein